MMAGKNLHSRRIWTRKELFSRGKSKAAIDYALSDGRIFVVHAGVYAVGHPRLTDEERWLAAVLACGERALLDARSAAELREYLTPRGGPAQVLVPAARRIERPGIVIHRTRRLEPRDVKVHRGIPTTSLRRMFLALAATEDHRTLRRALRQAEYRGHTSIPRLRDSLDEAVQGLPGAAKLRRTLDLYATTNGVTESDPEDALLALCRRRRLPTPTAQFKLGPHRWDFAWPRERVVLDVDEYDGHHQHIPFLEDRAKDRHARERGHTPIRVADTELASEPRAVARSILDALEAAAA